LVAYQPQKFSARVSFSKKISIQMITLIGLFRIIAMKGKTKKKEITSTTTSERQNHLNQKVES